MIRFFSLLISGVFHPFLIPTYGFALLFYLYPEQLVHLGDWAFWKLTAMIFLNTAIYPVITLFLLRKVDLISSMHLPERRERIIPLIAMSLYYFWTFMVIKDQQVGPVIVTMALGGSLAVFILFFFNAFFKISAHTAAMGNWTAVMLFLAAMAPVNLTWALVGVIFASGLVGASRIHLDAHQPLEVYSGFIAGLCGQWIAFTFYY